MSWHKLLLITLLCLVVSACGFRPLYADNPDSDSTLDILSTVEIVYPEHDRMGQQLTSYLSDLINPNKNTTSPKYRINVVLTQRLVPLAIQKDRTVTRYKMVIYAKYELKNLETSKVIEKGTVKREGGYDRVESDYATFVSENSTTSNILKEIAEDFKLRLTSALL